MKFLQETVKIGIGHKFYSLKFNIANMSDLIRHISSACVMPEQVEHVNGHLDNDRFGNDCDEVMKIDNILVLCEKVQKDLLGQQIPCHSLSENIFQQNKKELYGTLKTLQGVLILVKHQISLIEGFAPQYDSRVGVKANGYRTFLSINGKVVDKLTEFLMRMQVKQPSYFSNYTNFKASFEYWIKYFAKLSKLNSFLIEMQRQANDGHYHLFPDVLDIKSNSSLENISEAIALEDVSVFFDGRGGGIHVHAEVQNTITFLIGFEACAADLPYFSSYSFKKIVGSLLSSYFGIKYFYDFEYLGEKIFTNAREQQVNFCKRFYNASELPIADYLMVFGAPSVSTNELISIPPKRLMIEDKDGNLFEAPIPHSHLGHRNLNVRFISSFRTKNMVGSCTCLTRLTCFCRKNPSSLSRSIIFHAHGGAFVSQTSKSHQTYLNHWAKDTGIPILSVDYSLAPEAPYPRATEEVFYAYCWMRDNFEMLGTTGENIIFAGDSAGANFVLGVALQCIYNRVPGPSVLTLFYPAMIVQTFPSPSRLLSLLDPLGMFPFLLRCMNSYTDVDYVNSCPRTYEEELEKCIVTTRDPLLSPIYASPESLSQFPRTCLFSSTIDTCLDESIEFSNKLVDAGVPVSLHVFQDLPHGFLSLNGSSKECQNAVNFISQHFKSLII